jgi:hypothetical protein
MTPDKWEVLERIGAYAASELPPEEARRVERTILEDPQALRLAESYLRMLALLGAVGEETPEVPRVVIDHGAEQGGVLGVLQAGGGRLRGHRARLRRRFRPLPGPQGPGPRHTSTGGI